MADALDDQIAQTVARGASYVLLLLWAGPNREQDETEQERLQHGHLRHLFGLRNAGQLLLNGPVVDGGDLVGIGIFRGTDLEAVRSLAEADPSVQAGRLRVDVRPWFGIPGDSI
jgi:uncharacterized protein YciI